MKNHSISIKAKTPSQRERILARLRKSSATIFHWKPIQFLMVVFSLMRATSADIAKVNADAEQQEK